MKIKQSEQTKDFPAIELDPTIAYSSEMQTKIVLKLKRQTIPMLSSPQF